MSAPAAGNSALVNVSLPGRGPGRNAVALALLTALVTTAVLGTIAVRSWYGEVQQRVATVHPAALEWSAESLLDRIERARTAMVAVGQGGAADAEAMAYGDAVRGLVSNSDSFSGVVRLDSYGQVVDSAGRGAALDRLLAILTVRSAVKAGLAEAMAATQLRRELTGVEGAAIRLFTVDPQRGAVLVSTPIQNAKGGFEGSLHGLVDDAEISAALRTDLLGPGTIHVAGEAGQVLGQAGDAIHLDGPLQPDALHASATPKLSVPWNAEGAWTVRSARPVGLLGMIVVAEQPVLVAFESMWLATVQIIVAGGVLALLFTLVGSLMAVRLTRRMQELLDGIRSIAKADFSARLSDAGLRGQLALIFAGFNEMARRLMELDAQHQTNVGAISKQNRGFQKQHQKLEKLCVTDELTQLHNHRFFQDQLRREIKRLSRTNEGLSILIIDIDDFKQLNDTYGHAAGDEFLRQLARVLKESVRETDVLARYGGEEFVVVAVATPLEGAHLLAEKLRTTVAETSFIVDETRRPRGVTISIGVAQFGHSRTELFTAADAALYRAKAEGKNCVVISEPRLDCQAD
ncbi:MAG: diguanylate cyclase [Deltaproteobacteria bacterium]|nr:diguanylate cyclase [Deltaproteobacteria bacterium]